MPSFAVVLRNYMPGVFGRRARLGRAEQKATGRLELPAPLGLTDFLALDIPPRAKLLDPILPEKGLAMLYAKHRLYVRRDPRAARLIRVRRGGITKTGVMPRRELLRNGEFMIERSQIN